MKTFDLPKKSPYFLKSLLWPQSWARNGLVAQPRNKGGKHSRGPKTDLGRCFPTTVPPLSCGWPHLYFQRLNKFEKNHISFSNFCSPHHLAVFYLLVIFAWLPQKAEPKAKSYVLYLSRHYNTREQGRRKTGARQEQKKSQCEVVSWGWSSLGIKWDLESGALFCRTTGLYLSNCLDFSCHFISFNPRTRKIDTKHHLLSFLWWGARLSMQDL